MRSYGRLVSRELRQAYLGTLITLLAQFLLGMVTNLFVDIPKDHPGANPTEYFSGVAQNVIWAIFRGPSLWLALHVILGLALVIFGFRLLFLTFRSHHRPTVITSIVGAIAMLVAGFNGGSFLNYHEDFSSMIMAGFFAIAVAAYVIGLFALPPQQESPTQAAR
jgi:hypothetical protein